ncbi:MULTISPECIES: hypothetical protein [Paenibacillus]|uniref:hypothetical protein n=1 Tax=Paenibacillus TaxID=44249 RepID=UPI002FE42415
MWYSAFAVRIAVEELSALEPLPVHPPEIHLESPVRPGILRQVLVLEKNPYMITPFNE